MFSVLLRIACFCAYVLIKVCLAIMEQAVMLEINKLKKISTHKEQGVKQALAWNSHELCQYVSDEVSYVTTDLLKERSTFDRWDNDLTEFYYVH